MAERPLLAAARPGRPRPHRHRPRLDAVRRGRCRVGQDAPRWSTACSRSSRRARPSCARDRRDHLHREGRDRAARPRAAASRGDRDRRTPARSRPSGAPSRSTQLDSAAIGTLHSFAQRLLLEHPIEAGIPPRIEVLDEVESGVALRGALVAVPRPHARRPRPRADDPAVPRQRASARRARRARPRPSSGAGTSSRERVPAAAPEPPDVRSAGRAPRSTTPRRGRDGRRLHRPERQPAREARRHGRGGRNAARARPTSTPSSRGCPTTGLKPFRHSNSRQGDVVDRPDQGRGRRRDRRRARAGSRRSDTTVTDRVRAPARRPRSARSRWRPPTSGAPTAGSSSTTCSCSRERCCATREHGAKVRAAAARPLPAPAARRVPGHRPDPDRARGAHRGRARHAGRRPARGTSSPCVTGSAVLRRRPEAVDLPVPPRRHRAVPRRPGDHFGARRRSRRADDELPHRRADHRVGQPRLRRADPAPTLEAADRRSPSTCRSTRCGQRPAVGPPVAVLGARAARAVGTLRRRSCATPRPTTSSPPSAQAIDRARWCGRRRRRRAGATARLGDIADPRCPPAPRCRSSRTRSTRPGSRTAPSRARSSTRPGPSATCC